MAKLENVPEVPLDRFDLADVLHHMSRLMDDATFKDFQKFMAKAMVGFPVVQGKQVEVGGSFMPCEYTQSLMGSQRKHLGYVFQLFLREEGQEEKTKQAFFATNPAGRIVRRVDTATIRKWDVLDPANEESSKSAE